MSSRSKSDMPNLERLSEALPRGMFAFVLCRHHEVSTFPNVYCASLPVDDDEEFRFRTGANLQRLIHLQPATSPLKFTKPDFDFVPSEHSSSNDYVPSLEQNEHVRIVEDGVRLEFLTSLRAGSSGLLVIGQSAVNRGVVKLPHFQRWAWGAEFEGGSFVVLHDPALFESTTLEAGWFFGDTNHDYVDSVVNIVSKIAQSLNLSSRDVFFYGGSAGGFTSFHMGSVYPGSRVIVDIPQINMRTYPVKQAAAAACSAAFGTSNFDSLPARFLPRVDVIERFRATKVVPEFLYLNNINDRGHFNSQFGYFLMNLHDLQFHHEWARVPFRVEVYDQKNFLRGGHVPLNREDTMKQINKFFRETRSVSP